MTAAVGWLPPATLTPSGLPDLLPGEIERHLLPSADLIPDDPTLPSILSSLLSLTTHRLIFLLPSSSSASLPLSSVTLISPPKKSLRAMFHSPRVRMEVGRTGGVTVVVRGKGKGDVDVFYGRLVEVWEGKAWDVGEKEREVEEVRAVSRTPAVGVSGILRKEQEMWESTDRSLRDAFQDLDALMSKAKEMVMLAEKMRLKLLSGLTSQGSTTNDEDMGSKQEMQDWLLSVGIASPVTKDSAGALYHQQLSRQLADFVRVPLERAGGMVSLVDVYCHFNRARGTALISPEDLLQACALWEKFDVPVMLRRFDSGVMVIQSKDHSDEEVFARINSLVQKPDALLKGISPSDAAMTLGITPALAKEHLLAAENKGLLCRDISPEGFRFYANLFKDIDLSNMYMVKEYTIFHSWVSATSVSG